MADEIKPPRAEALALQALAELVGKLADVARDRFHRADRLGEGAAHLDQLLRTDGLDWLGDLAGRLVKAAAELRTEAEREGRARLRQQVADVLEAELPEAANHIGREAQGGDRKGSDIARGLARLGHVAGPSVEAREGMGRAPAVGDGGADAKTDAAELLEQRGKHRSFVAIQVIRAGGVDDDSVWRIGGDDWRETPEHPQRQPIERLRVPGRIGVLNHQALDQRLGLRRGHADAKTCGMGCHVRRQHHPSPPFPAHQDQRRLRRRRCIARLPPDPIVGQGR